jgi:hypothetical protein
MPFSVVVTLTGRYWVTLAERRSIVYRQKKGVCTIVNTYPRIVEECPTAIHSVELWLKGFAAAGVSPISVLQMLGYSSR